MAKSLALASIQFLGLILISFLALSDALRRPLKETRMTYYIQEFRGTPNATVAAVAGIPGRPRGFNQFGTVFVADNKVTQGIALNSPQIGLIQGIFATSSFDGANLDVLFSVVFTNKKYNGSTLEIQGRSVQNAPVRELSLVSGTGQFRLVRGYITFETVRPLSMNYSVMRLNITMLQ